jgi:hypothetical protein
VLKRFLPQQSNFFELFQQAAHHMVAGAEQFAALTKDLAHAKNYADKIQEQETSGDDCALATFELLRKAFVTPFDRYDLHQLTRRLDDILDLINRNAQRIVLYKFTTVPEELQRIADLTLTATKALKAAISQLENMKNASAIIQRCYAITEIDHQAEKTMLQGVGKLFEEETDFKPLLKLKEVYQYSMEVVQQCHDLADVIKEIVLEYS